VSTSYEGGGGETPGAAAAGTTTGRAPAPVACRFACGSPAPAPAARLARSSAAVKPGTRMPQCFSRCSRMSCTCTNSPPQAQTRRGRRARRCTCCLGPEGRLFSLGGRTSSVCDLRCLASRHANVVTFSTKSSAMSTSTWGTQPASRRRASAAAAPGPRRRVHRARARGPRRARRGAGPRAAPPPPRCRSAHYHQQPVSGAGRSWSSRVRRCRSRRWPSPAPAARTRPDPAQRPPRALSTP